LKWPTVKLRNREPITAFQRERGREEQADDGKSRTFICPESGYHYRLTFKLRKDGVGYLLDEELATKNNLHRHLIS